MSSDRVYRALDLRKDPKDNRDYPFKLNINERLLLPRKIDHTNEMTPVKNQKILGSCVGFAVAAMKEWQEKQEHEEEILAGKKDHRKGKEYDLSEAWVYWNAKKIDDWPDEEGTSIRFAMKVLSKIGVPTEAGWPYNDINIGEPERWAHLIARWALAGSYHRIEDLNQLKQALVNGPVPIGFGVYEEFFSPTIDGYVWDPKDDNYSYGGHAVCAVGFNDDQQIIKIKNSWGTSWGKDGYGFLSYNYINRYMWDSWVSQDISVTKEMLKGIVSLEK